MSTNLKFWSLSILMMVGRMLLITPSISGLCLLISIFTRISSAASILSFQLLSFLRLSSNFLPKTLFIPYGGGGISTSSGSCLFFGLRLFLIFSILLRSSVVLCAIGVVILDSWRIGYSLRVYFICSLIFYILCIFSGCFSGSFSSAFASSSIFIGCCLTSFFFNC